jgi:hypothetical protein
MKKKKQNTTINKLTKNNKKKIERTMAPNLSGLSNNLMLT